MIDPIASREYTSKDVNGKTGRIIASLGRPYLNSDGAWLCDVEIRPVPTTDDTAVCPRGFNSIPPIRGIDSFQALVLAAQAVRTILDASDLEVFFLEVHGTGIERSIFGASEKIQRHLEHMVDAETDRIMSLLNDEATRSEALSQFF